MSFRLNLLGPRSTLAISPPLSWPWWGLLDYISPNFGEGGRSTAPPRRRRTFGGLVGVDSWDGVQLIGKRKIRRARWLAQ
jgi:hypothetical protein